MNEDMTEETLAIKYYVTGEGTLVQTNGDLPDGVTQITEEEYSKAVEKNDLASKNMRDAEAENAAEDAKHHADKIRELELAVADSRAAYEAVGVGTDEQRDAMIAVWAADDALKGKQITPPDKTVTKPNRPARQNGNKN